MKNTQEKKNLKRHCFMKSSQGITLLSLVVTIVILLILAGITIILVLSDDGIFKVTNQARIEHEIAVLKDRIEVIKVGWITDNFIDPPNITLDDFWNRLVDNNIIRNPKKDVTKIEEGLYELDTTEGYLVEVWIDDDENITIGDIIDKDKAVPKIRKVETSTTTNSITITVDVVRLYDGKLTYLYKLEDEAEYTKYKQTTETTVTIPQVLTNKMYNIQIIAENKNGKTVFDTNVLTGELPNGTIRQKGATIWKDGLATIELETTKPEYQIQYQIGEITGTWIDYTGPISELKPGETVYPVLTDGYNLSDEASITIIEKIPPEITITKGNIDTKNISISVTSKDLESGMDENPTYHYYIKKSEDPLYPDEPSYEGINTYTFQNLSQDTNYDIKVTVRDKMDNEGVAIIEGIKTKKVDDATEGLETGSITASVSWSNESATVTLSTNTNLTIEWQVGSITEGNWTPGTKVTGLKHGYVVFAHLTDGFNYGKEASITVLDKIPPTATITLDKQSMDTNSSVKAKVVHSDGQSGVDIRKCKWAFNQNSNYMGIYANYDGGSFTSNSSDITLTADSKGIYYLHILTVDKAGNKKETISRPVTVKQLVTSIKLNKTTASIKTEEKLTLTATITPSTAENKNVTWSSSDRTIATVDTQGIVTGVKEGNVKITATAQDGSGVSATCNVTVNYPTIEEKLREGNYVYYKDKNGRSQLCVVLYDKTSGYGTQIITRQRIGTVKLGNTVFSSAKTSYNNAISTLNSEARSYLNTSLASSARCVGTNPSNPTSDSPGYYTNSATFMKGHSGTLKKADTNYTKDYNKMSSLGILYCDGAGNNASYWLASREISGGSTHCSFEIRSVGAYGLPLSSQQIVLINDTTTNNTVGYAPSIGLRPVFTLKPTVKVTGGKGTSSSPYTLGT